MTVILEFKTAGEAQALLAYQQQAQAAGGVEKALKAVNEESRKAAREQREAGAMAKRVWEDTRTPVEAYQSQLQKLSGLLQSGRIDQETYGRAVKQAGDEMQRATNSQRDHMAGMGALKSSISTLAGMATSWLSIGGAIKTASQYLDDMQAKAKAAGDKALESEGGMARLALLAGTKKEYAGLTEAARKTYAAGAAPSLAAAADLTFQLQSMGAMGERALFERLGSSMVVANPAATAMSAESVRSAFGGKGGNLQQLIGMAFAAQTKAPVTAQDIMTASAEPAAFAKMAGVSPAEMMSAIAAVSVTAGGSTPDEKARRASTQTKSLFAALTKITSGMSAANPEMEGGQALEEVFAGEPGVNPKLTLDQIREKEAHKIRQRVHAMTPSERIRAVMADKSLAAGYSGMGEGEARASISRHPAPLIDAMVEGRMRELTETPGLMAQEYPEKVKATKAGQLGPEQIAAIRALRGKSFKEQIVGIQALGLGDATLMKLLGRKEATIAFNSLASNLGNYESTLTTVQSGAAGKEMEASIGIAEQNPELLAARLRRQSKARLEMAEERRGMLYNVAETLSGDLRLRMKKDGWGDPARWTVGKVDDFERWVSTNQEYISSAYPNASPGRQAQLRQIMGWGPNGPPPRDQETWHGTGHAAPYIKAQAEQRLLDAADKLSQAADSMGKAGEQIQRNGGSKPADLTHPGVDK